MQYLIKQDTYIVYHKGCSITASLVSLHGGSFSKCQECSQISLLKKETETFLNKLSIIWWHSLVTLMQLRQSKSVVHVCSTVKTFWLLQPYFGHLSCMPDVCMPDVCMTHYKTSKGCFLFESKLK